MNIKNTKMEYDKTQMYVITAEKRIYKNNKNKDTKIYFNCDLHFSSIGRDRDPIIFEEYAEAERNAKISMEFKYAKGIKVEPVEDCPVIMEYVNKMKGKSKQTDTVSIAHREQQRDNQRERQRRYYKENKERLKDYRRAYYNEHKDEIIEKQNKYRRENIEKIREHQKAYRIRHKEEISDYKREYRLIHKGEINRKARVRANRLKENENILLNKAS